MWCNFCSLWLVKLETLNLVYMAWNMHAKHDTILIIIDLGCCCLVQRNFVPFKAIAFKKKLYRISFSRRRIANDSNQKRQQSCQLSARLHINSTLHNFFLYPQYFAVHVGRKKARFMTENVQYLSAVCHFPVNVNRHKCEIENKRIEILKLN